MIRPGRHISIPRVTKQCMRGRGYNEDSDFREVCVMANFFRNPKYNAERILQKNLENGVLSEDDSEIIRSFISYLSVTGTQNPITLRNYVNHICALQRLSPRIGVRDLTTEMIFSKTKSLHDSEYKQNTKAIIPFPTPSVPLTGKLPI